jgi:hypothetical protein
VADAQALAQEISADDRTCPRCHTERLDIESDVGHVEFACGSWVDDCSEPWWDEQCYRNQGVSGLRELVLMRARVWHDVDLAQGTDLFLDDLERAVRWLVAAENGQLEDSGK